MADKNAESNGDSIMRQRGTTSPKYGLEEAIGFLDAVYRAYGDRKASREALAQALGHQTLTGAVTPKIGALTHFDLLAREGESYRVSDIGQRILHPRDDAERQAAIVQAAKSPNLYSRLFSEFNGKAIPALFENILKRDHGVTEANAPEVAATFRKTAEFAGLVANGLIAADGTPMATTAAQSPNGELASASRVKEVMEVKEAPGVGGSDRYTVPLTKGRIASLSVPRPITSADLDRLKKWLDLMADVLTEVETPAEQPA